MNVRNLVQNARRKAAKPHVSVRISDDRITASTVSPLITFTPGRCYLEVRLAQMHLRDRREWWREFLPLASVVTELQAGGQRSAVPFVGGASMLGDQLRSGPGYVEVLNKRVAGPVPYAGDQVSLFAVLYRTAYQNWAEQALSLLEGVAKLVDVTRLSSFVTLAPGIVSGLEGLMGMQEVELRLGVDRDLVPAGADAGESEGALRPGWFALFGADGGPRSERLHVCGDRLHVADDRGELTEYRDQDFLLVNVRALDVRDDYETFDFHQVHWNRLQDRLWEYELDGARTSFGAFTASLMQCADLTREQRRNLWAHYDRMYREDLEQVAKVHDGTARLESTERRRTLAGAEVARLAASPAPEARGRDAEKLLDAFAG